MTTISIIILAISAVCLIGGQIWASYLLVKDRSCTRLQLQESAICTVQIFGLVLLLLGLFSLIVF